MTWNNQMFHDYSQAYIDIMDNDPNTQSYNQFLHLGAKINDQNKQQYQTLFKNRKDRYRRWRDMSLDRKSTRLNSSHANISYAVFCLKKSPYTFSAPITFHHSLPAPPFTSPPLLTRILLISAILCPSFSFISSAAASIPLRSISLSMV